MAKTNNISGATPELLAKIKSCDKDVSAFVFALNEENRKLATKIAALEASNTSLSNSLDATQKHKTPQEMSTDELEVEIVPEIVSHIRIAGGWAKFCKQNKINSRTLAISKTKQ